MSEIAFDDVAVVAVVVVIIFESTFSADISSEVQVKNTSLYS